MGPLTTSPHDKGDTCYKYKVATEQLTSVGRACDLRRNMDEDDANLLKNAQPARWKDAGICQLHDGGELGCGRHRRLARAMSDEAQIAERTGFWL